MAAQRNSAVPTLGDIIAEIKAISSPYELGIHLGIDEHELDKIEKNYPRDVERQKVEAIKYWQRNFDCSWEALADAVEKMQCHRNLVKLLRELHLKTVGNHVEAGIVDKAPKKGNYCNCMYTDYWMT
jgi:hypothetical protein